MYLVPLFQKSAIFCLYNIWQKIRCHKVLIFWYFLGNLTFLPTESLYIVCKNAGILTFVVIRVGHSVGIVTTQNNHLHDAFYLWIIFRPRRWINPTSENDLVSTINIGWRVGKMSVWDINNLRSCYDKIKRSKLMVFAESIL